MTPSSQLRHRTVLQTTCLKCFCIYFIVIKNESKYMKLFIQLYPLFYQMALEKHNIIKYGYLLNVIQNRTLVTHS